MLKEEEIEIGNSCWNKAKDQERMFILLARDAAAPVAIRAWVEERIRLGKNEITNLQIIEALECAKLMEESN